MKLPTMTLDLLGGKKVASFPMRRRKIILAEFAVTVYTDGTINWDRFDQLLWRLMYPKPARASKLRVRYRLVTPKSAKKGTEPFLISPLSKDGRLRELAGMLSDVTMQPYRHITRRR